MESKISHIWTYLQNRNRLTDIDREETCGCRDHGGGGMECEFGVSRCKLLHIEWINNKVLLCGTGNNTQYPVIKHKEKNIYIYIYICITESLCCTVEINIVNKPYLSKNNNYNLVFVCVFLPLIRTIHLSLNSLKSSNPSLSVWQERVILFISSSWNLLLCNLLLFVSWAMPFKLWKELIYQIW